MYKCHICHDFIKDEELHTEPLKDRTGNYKYLKNGSIQTKKSHIQCFLEHKENIAERTELMKYLESTYFKIVVPKEMVIQLNELRNKVSFKNILSCLKSIEHDLKFYIEKITFNNDVQKSFYIMSAIKNNINTFVENKKIQSVNKIVEQNELNNNIIFINRKSQEVKAINYDILD
jgi:hypothetical protein